jgi:hypothetical protein
MAVSIAFAVAQALLKAAFFQDCPTVETEPMSVCDMYCTQAALRVHQLTTEQCHSIRIYQMLCGVCVCVYIVVEAALIASCAQQHL